MIADHSPARLLYCVTVAQITKRISLYMYPLVHTLPLVIFSDDFPTTGLNEEIPPFCWTAPQQYKIYLCPVLSPFVGQHLSSIRYICVLFSVGRKPQKKIYRPGRIRNLMS